MKKLILTLAFVVAAAFIAVPSYAEIVGEGVLLPFIVSADVPSATTVSITATKMLGVDGSPVETDVSALNFNTGGKLVYKPALGIFLSDFYYAIDVGVGDGVGAVGSVTTTYTVGSSPQAIGLEKKATATFVKAVTSGSETNIGLGKVLLSSLIGGGSTVNYTAWSGGWFRVYVGIYDGGDATLNADGGQPFTGADVVGPYTGTLTLSATLL
ncbi:MAG: hypothetical protein KKD07_10520 [Candidatus Omnitrophica bacterium]|nr:hypothetical protein [Candidatus Omnitrophota bacterium]MBU1996916.1 hypothetical protein [Candidatus Omnitrophota bacterium]MBU4334863.1 hypothetical protein [Candidatus Omnitrophota bacterium]